MRGPVGLVEQPKDLEPFDRWTCHDPGGDLELWIDREIVTPKVAKSGQMLVAIEGFGRFRLHLDPPA